MLPRSCLQERVVFQFVRKDASACFKSLNGLFRLVEIRARYSFFKNKQL